MRIAPPQLLLITRGFLSHLTLLLKQTADFRICDWTLLLKMFGYRGAVRYCDVLQGMLGAMRNQQLPELSEELPEEFSKLYSHLEGCFQLAEQGTQHDTTLAMFVFYFSQFSIKH